MWRITAPDALAGGEITTIDGSVPMSVEQGISVVCGHCGTCFDVRREHIAHRQFPTIICHRCENLVAIQYGDDPFLPPWDILEMSGETPTDSMSVDGEEGGFRVFDERSGELTSIHRAGECLARATSREFTGDGHYSRQSMNTLLVAEPDGTAVGYLTWNTFDSETSTYPALRQIYFMPEYRRRGLGSALVEFWIENVVDDLVAETPNHTYCVEQPNDDMMELLWSLGHDDENEGGPTASNYTPNQM